MCVWVTRCRLIKRSASSASHAGMSTIGTPATNGAIAVDTTAVPRRVFVGTGEGNFTQDGTLGVGVYFSVDGGSTFTLSALPWTTAFGASLVFDEFPYGLLTMVVSLEAIFLATFVMVSQNRQAKRSDIRSDLDFENNLRGEIWSVHIGQALGIDADHVEQVVLEAIEGYRRETSKLV